ncbi:MAG TPA: gas vesicle protein [Vicinamibacterales bacterium]
MKRRKGRPRPGKSVKPSTVRRGRLAQQRRPPGPFRPAAPPKPLQRPPNARARARRIAQIVDDEQTSLLDLIDNLLNKGVMLNADLVLALADVDLVYVRLSALLCAADRVMPRGDARRRE